MRALSVSSDGDKLGVVLRGEIDFVNAAPIATAICADVARNRPAQVRVDLGEVTFLDSSGIGVLVTAMRAAGEVGAAFQVTHPNRNVCDQLSTVGLVEAFGLDPVAVRGGEAPAPISER
jgi:anti-sigma B factor antagonist